jgi:hypothetical protein
MRPVVRAAFLAIREQQSPDVVIADSVLNERFIRECRSRGLTDPPFALNLCLFSLRKTGDLQGIRSSRTVVPGQELYRFASEIAIRFLERRDQRSLDTILCDPERAAEFDKVAAEIAPGYSSFQYRWAALNLRKTRRLKPELLGKVVKAEAVVTCGASDLVIEHVPAQSGLYILFQPQEVLYVGECQNLRKRLAKHLDHSDNKSLARWLWEHGISDLHVEYHVLPSGVATRVRKAMEAELIKSRRPAFNVSGND